MLTLLLRQVFTCAKLNACLEVDELSLLTQDAKQMIGAILYIALLKQHLFFTRLKGDIGGQEMNKINWVVDITYCKLKFSASFSHLVEHIKSQLFYRADNSFKLSIILLWILLVVE